MKQNSSVPAFLSKLWALLEDSGTDQLVSWSRNGTCFQVSNEGRFAKEILPLYFKHSNMPSFIRQLNMYGFHKVVLVDGRLPRDLDDVIEFQHPYFRQGEAPLLENIKRKVSVSRTDDVKLKQQEVSKILSEVRQMKGKQDLTDNRILAIKRENEALWNEISSLKQKQLQQHQVIRKVLIPLFPTTPLRPSSQFSPPPGHHSNSPPHLIPTPAGCCFPCTEVLLNCNKRFFPDRSSISSPPWCSQTAWLASRGRCESHLLMIVFTVTQLCSLSLGVRVSVCQCVRVLWV
uniref:HSF-type DNA-binding domain-containing protein n=1 Tax=Callorhinchus milii TaxID=7868 RepID=A0A4W3JTK6_CALMI